MMTLSKPWKKIVKDGWGVGTLQKYSNKARKKKLKMDGELEYPKSTTQKLMQEIQKLDKILSKVKAPNDRHGLGFFLPL